MAGAIAFAAVEVGGGAMALGADGLEVEEPFMGEELEAEGGGEEVRVGKKGELLEAGAGELAGELGRFSRELGLEEILRDLACGGEPIVV